MRLLIHDYGRFPFIFQLAREMAARGHHVCYACCAGVPERSALNTSEEESENLQVVAIPVSGVLAKIDFIQRRNQEIAHGKALERLAETFRPDVVISANTPLDPQSALLHWCKHRHVRFVYWLQDLYGLAIREVLKQRLPFAGAPIAAHYMWMERRLIARSDAVVVITEDFRPHVARMGARNGKVHRLENWAPLDQIPVRPKDNPWSRKHDLHDKQVYLYSGTMGMKHDPQLLIDLAGFMRHDPHARVVVVAQGSALGWLTKQVSAQRLDNLVVMPLQAPEDLPDVLGSADVLVAVLADSAGVFSVPSKVLTYMCAGRPLLLAVPKENLAARVVTESNAGLVVDPKRVDLFLEAADCLMHESDFRQYCGRNARRYAEVNFDIEAIADCFERIVMGKLDNACSPRGPEAPDESDEPNEPDEAHPEPVPSAKA